MSVAKQIDPNLALGSIVSVCCTVDVQLVLGQDASLHVPAGAAAT